MTSLPAVRLQIQALADPRHAAVLQRFFKTGPGEYGEGDRFLGIRVPQLRRLARDCRDLSLPQIGRLLRSKWHEERLLSLFLLVHRYPRCEPAEQEEIYRLYLASTRYINNWDLVDSSAEYIVGAHLREGSRAHLRRLAKSKLLWERRIAMLSTYHYIKRRDYPDALAVARLLLDDPHDLIHKACGWMIREIGNRDREVAEGFLREHAARMPRTMLRYAIERFPAGLRQTYMAARVR